ncbi:MAG: PepSY-associated TM helix domain-containing protein [Bryobacteraceae bacterium]
MKRETLKWARTIHIYLSLSAFAMLLFFAITGVMLTHDSFGLDQVQATSQTGKIDAPVAKGGEQDAVIAATRKAFAITIPLTNFNPSEDEIELAFAGPSKRAQVFVKRATGEAEATFEARGFVGLMADLHKGAETGWAWRGLLDVVSVWIALSSITGFIMLLALPKRQALGLVFTVVGTILTLAVYAIWVPR